MSLYARSVQGSTDHNGYDITGPDSDWKMRKLWPDQDRKYFSKSKTDSVQDRKPWTKIAVRGSLVKSKDESFKVNIKNYRAWPTSQESLSIKACNVRESNPGLPRGRREFYHWTNVACVIRISKPSLKPENKACKRLQWSKQSLLKLRK